MIITKKALSRRTVLRGMGACLALPVLESMTPALTAAAPAKAVRSVFIYAPNGMVMSNWTPVTSGVDFELPSILKSFEAHRKDMLVLTGMMDHNGNALGDGGGDHARAGGSFLTGIHPAKTAGKDIRVGISVDQVAANAVGSATRLRSLELGCEDSRTVGNCDSGYSCAYTNSLSWRGPSTPNPPETNPRAVFERLFGADDITLPAEVRAKRLADRKSILDSVQDQVRALLGTVGGSDRRKLDEYLSAVREIEIQIQAAERKNTIEVLPGFERPDGVPFEYAAYATIMLDLAAAALQTDSTRVVTVVLGREGSLRTYPEIGISDGHHPLSHHGNRPEALEKLTQINQYHADIVSGFIGKLKATPDGDGTLLDRSMVLYGSGLSDSNRHLHENLPVLLFGRGNGSVSTGRHVVLAEPTPMTNLYLSMLDQMNVRTESLGDSTGALQHLTL
jgi:hypothetical protein